MCRDKAKRLGQALPPGKQLDKLVSSATKCRSHGAVPEGQFSDRHPGTRERKRRKKKKSEGRGKRPGAVAVRARGRLRPGKRPGPGTSPSGCR